jgi:uncharacterized protein
MIASALDSAVAMLREGFGVRLRTVVLFGSRARGDARADSDYDLLVVADGLPREPVSRLREVRMALRGCTIAINTVAKTPEEFERNLTPLLLDACVDGRCLHGEDFFERHRRAALAALKSSGLARQRTGKTWSWKFEHPVRHDWELQWGGFRELA